MIHVNMLIDDICDVKVLYCTCMFIDFILLNI